MLPLGLLRKGEKGEIVDTISKAHHGSHRNCRRDDKGRHAEHCRVEDMGFRAGKTVEMLKNEGRGPLLVKIDDARISIGRGMAMKIIVRRKD